MQIIPNKDITQSKLIGKGGFGRVYSGMWHSYDVAIKELILDKFPGDLETEFMDEAKRMYQFNHPKVVHLYGVCTNPYKMVMELCPKGNLYQLLKDKNQALPWKSMRAQIASDVGVGLGYLHKNKVIHRDLKSCNILLTENFGAKIGDFGFAKIKSKTRQYGSGGVGTLRWMAPELLNLKARLDRATDMYAYGIVLWEIAARRIPFQDIHSKLEIMNRIKSGQREGIPDDCPSEVRNVIEACCSLNPRARPTAKEAVERLAGPSSKEEVNAHFTQGLSAFGDGKVRKAISFFQQAAKDGYPPAHLYLFLIAQKAGSGEIELIEEINDAIVELLAEGEIDFGEMQQRGATGAGKAFAWFQDAVKSASAESFFQLGVCYRAGLGTKVASDNARKYFQLAAKKGNVLAKENCDD